MKRGDFISIVVDEKNPHELLNINGVTKSLRFATCWNTEMSGCWFCSMTCCTPLHTAFWLNVFEEMKPCIIRKGRSRFCDSTPVGDAWWFCATSSVCTKLHVVLHVIWCQAFRDIELMVSHHMHSEKHLANELCICKSALPFSTFLKFQIKRFWLHVCPRCIQMHANAPCKSINYMSGLLHHPSLYAYIHKHHHRSVYPFRGNVDARNEHPIEQLRLGSTIKFARQATSGCTTEKVLSMCS